MSYPLFLGTMYDVNLGFIGKLVVDFLLYKSLFTKLVVAKKKK